MLAVFYSWMFIPWITGLYCLYVNRKNQIYLFLIYLILLMPLPAALADNSYSTQRVLPLLLPYFIVIMIGIDKIFQYFRKFIRVIILFCLIGFSLVLLWRSYFVLFPIQRAKSWNYGYEQLATYIKENLKEHFVIDSGRNVPYILLLFWLKYPPAQFQKETRLIENYYWNVSNNLNAKFSNIEVRPIIWETDMCKNQIVVGDKLAISDKQKSEHFLKKLFEIQDFRQETLLSGYKTDPVGKKCLILYEN